MTIILIVIISISFLFILLFSMLLLPFKIRMDFSFVNNQLSGNMSFFWGSPLFISVIYDSAIKQPDVRIFGRQIGAGKKRFTKETPSDTEPINENSEEIPDFSATQEKSIPEKTESSENNSGNVEEDFTNEKPQSITGKIPKQEDDTHKQKAEKSSRKKAVEKKVKKKENVISMILNNKIFVFLGNQNWREKIIKLIVKTAKSLLRILSVNRIKIHVWAGLKDPALLGNIYALFISIVNGLCLNNRKIDMRFQPVFMKELFEMNGSINVRSSPARFIYPVFVALTNFPYLSTFLLWRKATKSGKVSEIDK